MAGLGLGAWGSGLLTRRFSERFRRSALKFYALTELIIGISAVLVPYELEAGRRLLDHSGLSSSWEYYLISAIWVALTLVPWCAFMGATIPVAMEAIRNGYSGSSNRSFSYLYAANVLGATLGAFVPLLLIELYGFRGTLRVGAVLNGLLAISALMVARKWPAADPVPRAEEPSVRAYQPENAKRRRLMVLLFLGGLTSMGAEVVWIRQFTPYLGTMVYAFAFILGTYLISTFAGSWIYRRWSRSHQRENATLWIVLGLVVLLPVITADPSLRMWQDVPGLGVIMGVLRVGIGIVPFCMLLGFVTPMLVDRWSGGDPDKAGRAYAVNVIGCILGPLLSGFLLLPFINERWVLFAFALPWLVVGFNAGWWTGWSAAEGSGTWRLRAAYAVAGSAILLVLLTKSYESRFPQRAILRDNTATSLAIGEGRKKQLLVNGRGMTGLTPITKMMAHVPLAFLSHPPQSALVVCFGMGTTFRSMLSWNIQTTVVELVPSVPRLFWYFESDADQLLRSPLAHVEIDDGRRYLERTSQQYDVITIDPPPPVWSAGSSLLYSKEFYSTIKQRLKPGGILQQWLPRGDAQVQTAVARALVESCANVRAFHSIKGWGLHFLASDAPFPARSADDLVRQMPPTAVSDMMEWGPYAEPQQQFSTMLATEVSLDQLLAASPQTTAMQDDRPVNEYFLLRMMKNGAFATLGGYP